ncbi:Mediator of RNA polymerase II transcription subunit 28 [Apodemus speciosus]|uniref:Mediator of RNA polymerase II transcription subunit 28 n=1 Tax=Apodemus speciosus TaxID=105296 RepID=A0ABQ0ERF9_APOSI
MAASLGGMFTGQPPGPPPPPPGLPGQASLLQAAPGASRPSNSTLVDELESSFECSPDHHGASSVDQADFGHITVSASRVLGLNKCTTTAWLEACFASLVSQDYVNGTDQEEIRTGVDQCIQKFLDIARQTECFFLQKRLQLSVQKPDQVIKEDVSELRSELQRKDALVQKHLTKLRHWQQVLEDINVQHKKPADMPQGSLAYLEQASANIPAPLKQT